MVQVRFGEEAQESLGHEWCRHSREVSNKLETTSYPELVLKREKDGVTELPTVVLWFRRLLRVQVAFLDIFGGRSCCCLLGVLFGKLLSVLPFDEVTKDVCATRLVDLIQVCARVRLETQCQISGEMNVPSSCRGLE